MTAFFHCGLVVGKFSPLHRGHQLVIDTALARCQHVVIISYSRPELAGCDAPRRERWLAQLYPQTTRLVLADGVPENAAPDETHREFVAQLLRRHDLRIDAVFTSEDYGPGFARHLNVIHIPVDRTRDLVPISGTQIRADVHSSREYLDPRVYASFVARVVLLGGESSGKSTLAAALATEFQTQHVQEYGRERWEAANGQLTFEDMELIAREQIAREDAVAGKASRFLFCDTSPLTTLFYSHDLFGKASETLELLACRRYDHHFLCAPDFDFIQDGTRRDADFRMRQHRWYSEALARREIEYTVLQGALPDRVARVRAQLQPDSA